MHAVVLGLLLSVTGVVGDISESLLKRAAGAKDSSSVIPGMGGILDVIEDYIEIGVDVLQIDQQDNMGIDELARRYAGRICFFCPVDIQTTLPGGSFEQIEAKVKELVKAFGSKGGGFMAKTYPQPEAINIPEANTRFMCEMFRKFGKYP